MIRMNQFSSAREAKDYYTAALRGGDYYSAEEQDCTWHGRLAERLGLGKHVTQQAFTRLSENKHPLTGERLTPRTNLDRTIAYDINFHVPKGVSVLHLVSGDDRILEAIRESVRETMRDLEQQARTRVRKGGKTEEERPTGELLWGEFLHKTTRPGTDGIPDVHLHVHCFTFNVTYDAVEERFKAAQFRDMKRDMPFHQQAFYARLAWRLEELGYRTERNAKGWDIAGIPDSVKREFSRRTLEIENLAVRLGIKSAKDKAELGARTRSKKNLRFTPEELRRLWLGRIKPNDLKAVESVITSRSPSKRTERTELSAASIALEAAIGHSFTRASVVPEPRLLEEALRVGIGALRPNAILAVAAKHLDLLRRGEGTRNLVTTRPILAEEEKMLAFARDGRGTMTPLEGERRWMSNVGTLNRQQERAVGQLLRSSDRVQILRGGAGTGKTALLREFAKAVESRGHHLTVLGSTTDASRTVLRKAGFGEANTIAWFLEDPERQRASRGGVIFADETGLVGTPTMVELFDAVKRLDARLILCGDSKQHAPIQRGDALRLLETRIGLMPAELSEVVRQRGTYKQAVESLHRGEYDKGLQTLMDLGAIREVKGRDWSPLVNEYIDTIKTGRSAFIISPTHAEGQGITDLVRASLRREGKIGQDDRLVPQLRDLGWTAVERSDAARYEPGQVVQFHRSVRAGRESFKPGTRFVVRGRDDRGDVVVADGHGHERVLPVHRSDRFLVFEPRLLRLATGDQIRATGNGRSANGKHRINNGALFRISAFTPEGHIKLDNGWEVTPQFGRLTHAYVGTSHASQGRTVDWVFVAQGSESAGAASAEQVYVSVSRGREGLRIYTDSANTLIEAAKRLSHRQSAVELMSGTDFTQRSREHAAILARLNWHEPSRSNDREQTRTREHRYER